MARSATGRAARGLRGAEPRGAVPRVRRGGKGVTEVQRSRMLSSAVRVVAEEGFERMSVARVTGGARVSRRTFYDVFEDREDCFLAVFEDALAHAEGIMKEAYERELGSWPEKVRAVLGALLLFLDERPEMRAVLVTGALVAGPRVLERRAEVLARAGARLHEEAARSAMGRGRSGDLPGLIGEAVVGAVFGLVHARCAERSPRPLVPLLGELMGVFVLAYEGPSATRREMERPVPKKGPRTTGSPPRGSVLVTRDPLEGLSMRLTYRTVRVLSSIAERPGSSNREIGEMAELSDQGQTSKLLRRLERLGLICNAGLGHPRGETNAWQLTPRGVEVERAVRMPSEDGGSAHRPRNGGRRGSRR